MAMAVQTRKMNYSRFFNQVSARRKPSPIRTLVTSHLASPTPVIQMAIGAPNTETFPFVSATIQTIDGNSMDVDSEMMKRALQYSGSKGLSELLKLLKEMQISEHNPPTVGYKEEEGQMDLMITTGSQNGIYAAFQMVLSPGDSVLLQSPTFPGTLAVLRPLGLNILGVESDAQGLIPSHLEEVMTPWRPQDAETSVAGMPKMVYCNPNGGNPDGSSMSLERKKQIYHIARKYDLLILEDDPYYYLTFVKPRVPSFLSMDVDGRVLRLDSFSKIFSAGMRLGYMTGPKTFIEKIGLHIQACNLEPSTFCQALIHKLLSTWGPDKFQRHVDMVADFYLQRKNSIMQSAAKWLTGLAEWSEPSGGIFLWMKLRGVNDTFQMIMKNAIKKEVIFVPGNAFMIDDTLPSSYIRVSYSSCTLDEIDKGMERLAELIKEESEAQK